MMKICKTTFYQHRWQLCLWQLIFFSLVLFKNENADSRETLCQPLNLALYELGALYYRKPSGEYTGIDKDVISEIEKRTNCHFRTSLESRVRIWQQLKQQSLDMTVSGIATPEREEFARFIPYFSTRNYLLLRHDVPTSAQSLEGFLATPHLQIGVVKSFKHGDKYDAWLKQLRTLNRVHEAADFDTVTRLFKAGRIHAMLALPTSIQPQSQVDNTAAKYIIRDLSPTDKIQHGLVLSKERVNMETFELLSRTIAAMRADGSLERIFSRHVDKRLAKDMLIEKNKP